MATMFYPNQKDYIEKLNELADGMGSGGSTNAADINIVDSGAYYASTNVEGALQEIGADIAGMASPTAVSVSITDAGAYYTGTEVETALQEVGAAIALKAPLASPALTGNPTAPTQSAGNNSTRIATTAFVSAAITSSESTTNSALALKAPLASPALTGTPTAPTAAEGTNTTQIATTAFVTAAVAAGGGGGGASTATDVSISDAGNYYTSTHVEGALQELGADRSMRITVATGRDFTSTDDGNVISLTAGQTMNIPYALVGKYSTTMFRCIIDVVGSSVLTWHSNVNVKTTGGVARTSPLAVTKHSWALRQTAANEFTIVGV